MSVDKESIVDTAGAPQKVGHIATNGVAELTVFDLPTGTNLYIDDTAGAKPVAWRVLATKPGVIHKWRAFCQEHEAISAAKQWPEQMPYLADCEFKVQPLYAAPPAPSVADTAGASDKPMTDAQIAAGWRHTFSTDNPYNPVSLKSFTKAVRWAERAKESSHD